jgi:DNA replication protein DnaC
MTLTAPAIDVDALLRRLHLPTVRRLYPDLAHRAEQESLGYRDFLALLMAEEVAHRAQTRIQRCVRRAHFPFLKTIDEYDFTLQAGVRLALLGSALSADFVTQGHTLIFSGPSGTGKTHLAVAIAYRAIQNGFDARFTSATALIEDLSTATMKGRVGQVLPAYTHPHVLVIDEVGYLSYGPDAANVLFQVVNDRYLHQRPMIFTTNKPLGAWGACSTIPISPKRSSIASSNAVAISNCEGRPTARDTSNLIYTKTSGHHRRHLPEFPEITGQSFRNPH